MIEWVKKLLERWGESVYSDRRRGGFGGYAFPAYQLVHTRSTGHSEPLVDSDIMWVDALMADIKIARPLLYRAAFDVYVEGLSPETAAGRSRCTRDAIHKRLRSLHELIENKHRRRVPEIATTNA